MVVFVLLAFKLCWFK